MKLLGFEITRAKQFSDVGSGWRGAWNMIQEPFSGAWQRNMPLARQTLLAFSAVYSCVSLIAGDISKLRLKLMQRDAETGVWSEVMTDSPYWPILRNPNEYQTPVQFLSAWVISKLLWGNTYVYITRDARLIPSEMHVLDPRLVVPTVTETGVVYYKVNRDPLSQIEDDIILPADDIMHDRAVCLFHPLVGVSPIYACASSAAQGIKIQENVSQFFENMSRPSGLLTTPDKITDETAQRLKTQWESSASGRNMGRLMVTGNGITYVPIMMSAVDAQLIETLKWSVEDVGRTFRVPLHKLGASSNQPFANIAALNQDYYSQTLQDPIEAIEALLNGGLGVERVEGKVYAVELDLEGLLRMDPLSRADRHAKLVGAGIEAPNEARISENLLPTEGGDSPMLQQQNYSLEALAKRDARPDPFAKTPASAALPAPATETPDTADTADMRPMRPMRPRKRWRRRKPAHS